MLTELLKIKKEEEEEFIKNCKAQNEQATNELINLIRITYQQRFKEGVKSVLEELEKKKNEL